MDHIETLTKILHIRDSEKKEAQRAHTLSVDTFEEVASKLYSLLKKKEDAENDFSLTTKGTTTIEVIKEQANYIENLNKKIIRLQDEVNEARDVMEIKRGKLTEAHVEVKKFEKLIEFRKQEHEQHIKKAESNSMDEISIQQYSTIR